MAEQKIEKGKIETQKKEKKTRIEKTLKKIRGKDRTRKHRKKEWQSKVDKT